MGMMDLSEETNLLGYIYIYLYHMYVIRLLFF